MGTDKRDINSVESMLDVLFDQAEDTKEGLACCSCFIDNRKYIVAMDLSYSSYLIMFIYNTENDKHFILKTKEEWDEVVKKVSDFLAYSDQSELDVSAYASYDYNRLEPNSDIVTKAIEQKRNFFICSYPETFENHYDPRDETGRTVLLITEFSDDFKQVQFFVHFENTDEAFRLSGETDAPDLVWNLYREFCSYEEDLQIREREESNRFYPKNKYDASDFKKVKYRFLEAIKSTLRSDIGIYSFRFRTDTGDFVAEIIAVSSELDDVRVIIYNIDTDQTFSRQIPGRRFFEEIFAVDLYIELFPEEAKAIYNRKYFDPMFVTIRQQVTDILDKANKEGSADCIIYAVNKEIPELSAKYAAEAVLDKDGNQIRLTVKDTFRENELYERIVEVGQSYDTMFSELYQFLYPNRLVLSKEDILEE